MTKHDKGENVFKLKDKLLGHHVKVDFVYSTNQSVQSALFWPYSLT